MDKYISAKNNNVKSVSRVGIIGLVHRFFPETFGRGPHRPPDDFGFYSEYDRPPRFDFWKKPRFDRRDFFWYPPKDRPRPPCDDMWGYPPPPPPDMHRRMPPPGMYI